MKKNTLVLMTYISYIYIALFCYLLFQRNHIDIEVDNVNGMIVLISFSFYVVWTAFIEGFSLYKLKSKRLILHFLVVLMSYLFYFNSRLQNIFLLIFQVILIFTLIITPFFLRYDDQTDESRRIVVYKYLYSHFIVFFANAFIIIKYPNVVLSMISLLIFYIVIQHSFSNLKHLIKSIILLIAMLVSSWFSSSVSSQDTYRVFSFDLIIIIANVIILYVLMNQHRKLYIEEIRQFDPKV
jgi:hypothetical protein